MSQIELRSLQSKKNENLKKKPYSLYLLGIPQNNSLICSSGCGDFRYLLDSKIVKHKAFKNSRAG